MLQLPTQPDANIRSKFFVWRVEDVAVQPTSLVDAPAMWLGMFYLVQAYNYYSSVRTEIRSFPQAIPQLTQTSSVSQPASGDSKGQQDFPVRIQIPH